MRTSLLPPKWYYLIILLMGVWMIGMSSAYLGSYKVNECVPIVNNLNATSVNITEITSPSPNAGVIVQNVEMTKIGNSFNYSFCSTSKIGNYNYGFTDNEGNHYSNNFDITPSGFVNTLGFYIVIAGLIIAIVILGVSLSELWFIVIAGMALILFGLYTINFGIADQKDMFMTWVIGLFEIGIGTILSLGAGYQKMNEDVW